MNVRFKVIGRLAAIAVYAAGTIAVASARTPPQTPVQTPPQTPAPAATRTDPAMPRVEFDEAIQRALDKNPTVAEAATAIARAEAFLQQARAATNPSVSVVGSNVTIDHSRGFQGQITQPIDQFTIGADVSYPVLAFSRWAAVTQAKDQIAIAKLSTVDTRRVIAVSTAQTYLAIVAAKRQVEVDERALANARAHLDYAQKRLDAGAGSRVNQLRAAAETATDEARIEGSVLALRRSQEALGVLLVENGPIDAGQEPVFDVPVDTNIDNRTDVRLQMATEQAAERVLKDSNKDLFPVANVSFDPQIVTPPGLFQPSKTWRLEVSFTQPIFTGGLQTAVKHERSVAVDAAKLALQSIQNQAQSEVRVAQESVASYERSLASSRLAADRANEVLRITTTAFEVGATTNLEVIDAQRSARDAETVATQAEDAARRARLDLLVALGRFPK